MLILDKFTKSYVTNKLLVKFRMILNKEINLKVVKNS